MTRKTKKKLTKGWYFCGLTVFAESWLLACMLMPIYRYSQLPLNLVDYLFMLGFGALMLTAPKAVFDLLKGL